MTSPSALASRSPARDIPYFAQWESRDLIPSIVDRSATAKDDPDWAGSGAPSVDEYAKWAGHLCGIACLRMILASYGIPVPPAYELAMQAKEWGAYVEQDNSIKGLIYQPLVDMVRAEYKLNAQVFVDVDTPQLFDLKQRADFIMASVHFSIRTPTVTPPHKGGHLVLIHDSRPDPAFVLHNPSGHTVKTQENAVVPTDTFDKFYAGRGISFHRED